MDQKVEELKGDIGKIRESINLLAPAKKKKGAAEEDAAMGFLIQQLESVLSEVDNLDKAVALGIPLTEYEGNISKLVKVENELNALEGKMNDFVSEVQDLRREKEDLNTLLKEGISERQVKMFESRIQNLEELQTKLMTGKSTRVVVELVEIIDDLNRRLKRLEELLKTASGESSIPAFPEIRSAELPAQKQEKQGFFEKIFGFFKSK
jgi:predicted  nucleic acid-binding Zn-ribbon protein